MKVKLYGKKYFARRDPITNYTFLYSNTLHYVLDIPSITLSTMYKIYNYDKQNI